ncbi:MAG: HD domain-containing protein [Candidatus Micrarchaeota archaeon]|nr:HD domain-containing protein [Candidatus Micrarchaeota archaeon]
MKFDYVIRDPIHGDIRLTQLEIDIINSERFQFLRKVKQLGVAYLVYPGATNTRFEHSLGVLEVTTKLAQNLIPIKELEKLRIASLLHDIGHCCFSHEGEFASNLDHEKKGLEFITKGEISNILKKHFSEKEINEIIDYYLGNGYGYLITSAIGSDRIDYLLRDAYYTGVAYGIIDKNRITQVFKLKNNSFYIEESYMEVVESILIARFMMFMNVYNHKTVRSFSGMLKHAIASALEKNIINYNELYEYGDETLLNKLTENNVELANDLQKRKLWKKILVVNYSDFKKKFLNNNKHDMKTIRKLSKEFSQEIGTEVIIEVPPVSYKEPDIKVYQKEKFNEIKKVSPLISSLKKAEHQRLKVIILSKDFNTQQKNKLVKLLKN